MAKEQTLKIRTRLGEREIAKNSVLYFPQGLIGFDDKREFALLPVGEESSFLLLQCVTDPRLGLLVTDPYPFIEDYEVKFGQAEKKVIRLETIRQAAVLVTVTIPESQPEKITLNLAGPIIINHKARLGIQVPQVDVKLSHYRPLEHQDG